MTPIQGQAIMTPIQGQAGSWAAGSPLHTSATVGGGPQELYIRGLYTISRGGGGAQELCFRVSGFSLDALGFQVLAWMCTPL